MGSLLSFPSPNAGLTYSKQGLQLTEDFEGLELTAYQDQGGVWTIGYGHTGHDVYKGLTTTQEIAEQLLLHDVSTAELAVKRFVKVALEQHEYDAIVDFTFNLGAGRLAASTLLKKLNVGDKIGAALEFNKWDRVAGKVSKGLARRRMSEDELFVHGVLQVAA